MRISSRISALAVMATVINLFVPLYLLVTTSDDRFAAMQCISLPRSNSWC